MKKTYQTPTMTVEKVDTTQIIAASAQMYGQDATGTAMGRKGYIFDDEEEDYDE
jgi:hypothetical protein